VIAQDLAHSGKQIVGVSNACMGCWHEAQVEGTGVYGDVWVMAAHFQSRDEQQSDNVTVEFERWR
jgi:nitrate reductase cytochrome c-type subunit